MSDTGHMGSVEFVSWITSEGHTLTIKVDRGELVNAILRKIRKTKRGVVPGMKITALHGAIVATVEKTK